MDSSPSGPQTEVIVAVDIDTTDSDHGLIGPMQEQIGQTYGRSPKQYLVDGGFTKLADIETAHAKGIEVFAPPPSNKHATDPFTLRKDDGPGTTAWRQQMASAKGKAIHRQRAKTECVNADLRNRGLQRLLLGGRDKVRAMLLWFALAHNVMRAAALRIAAAALATPAPFR